MRSNIQAELLLAWATAAGDPGASIARWVRLGAPAGITVPSTELDGLLPAVPDDEASPEAALSLATDYESFTNYSGVEDDPEVVNLILGFAEKGYLKAFPDVDSCTRYLGGPPVLSRFGCVTRLKWDAVRESWTTKKRVILDAKQSGVGLATTRAHRSVLPRLTDATSAALELMDELSADEEVEQLVLDVTDAFWEVPLRH